MATIDAEVRTCSTEGCETVLSRYNPSAYCVECPNPRATRRRDLRLPDDPVGDEWAAMYARGRHLDALEGRT